MLIANLCSGLLDGLYNSYPDFRCTLVELIYEFMLYLGDSITYCIAEFSAHIDHCNRATVVKGRYTPNQVVDKDSCFLLILRDCLVELYVLF